MTDWRTERDQALLTLERERRTDRRAHAAEVLQHLFTESAERKDEGIALVPKLLADRQAEVRRRGVAIAAHALPDSEVESFLAQRLRDPDEVVRIEAAGQLADLARPSVRPVLAAALEDESFSVRFEAARGMAALQHSAGLDVLVQALEREDLRFRALGALAELGNPDALPAIRRLFHRWLLPSFEWTQAAGVLAMFGEAEGAKHLLERTRIKRWSMDRALAIELCGEVKVDGAYERLSEVLATAKHDARGAAARGLGRLGDPRALPLLTTLLHDPSAPEDLRLDAADGLALLGTAEARAEIERALPKFGSTEAREALLDLLEEEEDA